MGGLGQAARLARSLAVPVALLLAWEGISLAGWVTPLILPSPTAVALRWWAYLAPLEAFDPAAGPWWRWAISGELPHDVLTSLMRIAVGFVIGAGLALPLGLLMGARPLVYELFNPLLQVLRPIPPIAYIPLAILWFGLGDPPAFFLISLGAFFPVLMNTIAGVRAVDAIYLRAARNLGAGQWTLFWRVMIPAAMPYILTGVRVGVGVAFIVVIVAEMIAVNTGLGYRILEAREYFWSDKVIAGMITIGLCGLGIDLGMSRLTGRLLRWHRGVEGVTAAGEPAIRARAVRKVFTAGGREVVALDGIDLDVAPGELICLLGPSGCGKSTLLNAIAGFSLPSSGELTALGRPVTGPGPDRAMVFQEYALFPWMTVERNVAFGLEIAGAPPDRLRQVVDSLLAKLGLTEFRDRFPKDLSGGMRQRVAIARVLAIDSPMLLMDEPFGALDALTRRSLQDELLRIWAELRKTIVFVTHGIEESIYLADRVVVMTYRPGTVKRIVPVTLPRPRDPASAEFNALKREVTALVMEEQARHQADEAHATAD